MSRSLYCLEESLDASDGHLDFQAPLKKPLSHAAVSGNHSEGGDSMIHNKKRSSRKKSPLATFGRVHRLQQSNVATNGIGRLSGDLGVGTNEGNAAPKGLSRRHPKLEGVKDTGRQGPNSCARYDTVKIFSWGGICPAVAKSLSSIMQ